MLPLTNEKCDDCYYTVCTCMSLHCTVLRWIIRRRITERQQRSRSPCMADCTPISWRKGNLITGHSDGDPHADEKQCFTVYCSQRVASRSLCIWLAFFRMFYSTELEMLTRDLTANHQHSPVFIQCRRELICVKFSTRNTAFEMTSCRRSEQPQLT